MIDLVRRDVHRVDWLHEVTLVLLAHHIVVLVRPTLLGQVLDVGLVLITMEGKA